MSDRKFRTVHLKAGDEVKVKIPSPYLGGLGGDAPYEVWIVLEGKSPGRGNRQTVRVEGPEGSSIEIHKAQS